MFKIEYSGNFTAAMKEYTEEKVYSKLQSVTSGAVKVVLTSLPDKKFDLEMSIDNKVRASSRGEDFYTLVIECTTKLFTQLTKYKKYLDKRNAVVIEEPEKLDQNPFVSGKGAEKYRIGSEAAAYADPGVFCVGA